MSVASARGWGDPGAPGSEQGLRFRRDNIVMIEAGGRTLYVNKGVSRLFKGFIDEITRRGYKINDGEIDDWGYNHRPIRGDEQKYKDTKNPVYLSNHSWGLAVDLNSRTNPMGERLKTDMPSWVVDCAEKWGLLWGGHYKGRKDPMHFEFVGTPQDVTRYPLPSHEEEDEMLNPEELEMLKHVNNFAVVEAPKVKERLKRVEEKLDAILEELQK